MIPKERALIVFKKKKVESKALMILKGEKVKNNAPFPGLNFDERDELFIMYDQYNGSIEKTRLDIRCEFGWVRIKYYVNVYGFENRRVEERRKRIETWKKESPKILLDIKSEILERVREMVKVKEIDFVTRGGKLIKLMKEPTAKELETAFKIVKTELGEPINITAKDDEYIPETEEEKEKPKMLNITILNDEQVKQIKNNGNKLDT